MASEAQQVLLAAKYDAEKDDPKGYWMSEKMDGVRAYWSGSQFYSRAGNEFYAPEWFTANLPKTPLDGELWVGRGMFQKCVGFVKTKHRTKTTDENWKFVTYLVFDAPSHGGPFESRYEWLKKNIDEANRDVYAAVVGHELCKGKEHLMQELKKVIDVGGEGLMLREAKSKYQHGRNKTLLKVKVFHDEEAIVTGWEHGSGRCADMMGKIHVELPNGIKFKIGTGFTDAQRKAPPKKGTVITFKYQEVSNSGIPRFPVFLRVRGDVTWKEVKDNAKTKKPFSEQKKKSVVLKKTHTLLYTTVPSREQSTGQKIVTDEDVMEPAINEPNASKKPDCKYGANCFQTNAHHLATFAHPEREEDKKVEAAPVKIPCKFGASCYRKNAEHREKYSHDQPDEPIEDIVMDEEENSAEEGIDKDTLKRTATTAITVADVMASVPPHADEVVEISRAELEHLRQLAAKASEDLEPSLKKVKTGE